MAVHSYLKKAEKIESALIARFYPNYQKARMSVSFLHKTRRVKIYNILYLCNSMKQIETIGIIGGGQLGKMLIEEGIRYNVDFITLDADAHSPASKISRHHITGSLYDAQKLKELASQVDVLTYEIEHINTEALLALEAEGIRIVPSPKVLQIVQDKFLQKSFFVENNIPTSSFIYVEKKEEWLAALQKNNYNKFAAKLCKGGYDGKGVALLSTEKIVNNEQEIPFDGPCILEQFVEAEKEISIIVNRNEVGQINCFDAVEMEFDAEANLVTYLKCPAILSTEISKEAKRIAMLVIEKMNGVGIFAVEMFVAKNGTVLVNEIAPRPHNSGHHSIEGCYTSQYEQLIRILLKKPLGDTSIIQASAMINILGAENFSGAYTLQFENELLEMPGVYIHDYGKAESKPMRKLGHITVLAATEKELAEKAKIVLEKSSVISK
jgi:5-(carboxyamino)imidazole ribonucleotide synthase